MSFKSTMKVWNFNLWHWLVPVLLISYQRNIFSHAAFQKFTGSPGCPPMQFLCLDGECLSEEKHCDGHPDCIDGTDEKNCEVLKCLEPNYFTCANDHCVSSTLVCDGENDCGDLSDERHCNHSTDSTSSCSSKEFQCLDRLCIPLEWVCDGEVDCLDSSDEYLGCTSNITCDGGFQCQNHYCIPSEWRCDGGNDCGDNSDEKNCPRREVPVEDCLLDHRMFRCHDGVLCIELYEVCNGKSDCLDGSDEGALCNEKDVCANSTCIHECYPSPTGALCVCPRGTFNDGHTCKDVNECEEFGICDHKCVNLVGGHQCFCDPGYALASDKKTCKAEGPEGLMLFSSHKQIRAYFLTSGVYYPVARDLSQVTGVAYDGQHVYWTSMYHGEESISRSLEDGSEREVIITAGLGSPEDLALDWITKNIYFTDSKFQHLGVCSNDGKVCAILNNKDIDKPRGICLSPSQGLMYWSDWGAKPVIARSGMDGSEVTEFVTKDIQWPNGLTIDHGNDRLYWVDAKLLVIESIKLDGTGRRVVLSEAIKHPYAVAVFENSLYWSDWTGQEIQRCNKFTGKDRHTVVREKNNRVFGVHIYHPAMMNSSIGNPCVEAGCSDLCMMAPASRPLRYACACPPDKLLAPNGHTCEQVLKRHSLLVGAGSTLLEVQHQRLGRVSTTPLPLRNVYKIGALAYDALTGNIIISDTAEKTIVSFNQMTKEVTVLISGNLGKVDGMDVDPYGHNLYWVDSERQTVEVLSLHSFERKVLLQDMGGESPIDVVLVPEEGFMFVALIGPQMVHIDRFNMDGDLKSRVHFVDNNVLGPNVALAYDKHIRHIFWSDSGTGNIEAVDVDGLERTKVRELYHSPSDIAVIEDDVFWTNHGSATLLWMNKYEDETDSSKQLALGLTQGLESVRLVAVTGLVSGHEHPCQQNNGGCSHICFAVPNKKICACPFGKVLKGDGLSCEMPTHCQVGQFRCTSGECIPIHLTCNRRADCPHGEDELHCKILTLSCPRGQFSCHDGEKCLDHHQKCDGTVDCQDRSDEISCHEQSTCRPGDFQCKSGSCKPMSWRCDGTQDCDDRSDEENCETATCHPEKEFRCSSGTCIPANWECDGQPDCRDASDEHGACVAVSSCGPDQLTCSNSRCVDKQLECDGQDDCEDGTDELDCPAKPQVQREVAMHINNTSEEVIHRPQCDETQFTCDVCLPATARCNGTAECLRGEDETGCDGCQDHQFQCQESGRCILHDWMCDGTNDCGDNSDEDPSLCQFRKGGNSRLLNHGNSECLEYTCKNLKCLPFSKVCDGTPDCDDKSDEGGRCGRGCVSAGCMDTCQETPSGPKCGCYPGYQLSGDSRTCSDVDECALGIYCAQFCQNIPGSFTCSCRFPDFQLRENRMTCKAKGYDMQFVYVVDNEIRYTTKSHQSLGVIHKSQSTNFHISGIEVDSRKKCIYWSSAQHGTVSRKCVTTRNTTETLSGLLRPTALALDWVRENIYVVERGGAHTVKVCHFGVQRCAVIVTSPSHISVDTLAVDPINNLVFWSESTGFGQTKSIVKKADLSGGLVSVVLDEGLQRLTDLAVDSLHQMVYWLDADRREVERISYNGTNKQTIFSSPDVPTKLALFEHSVYWLVEAQTAARRQSLDTYGNVWECALSGPTAWRCDVLKVHPRSAPSTFTIMQEASQEIGVNECASQCSHLCVGRGVCLCTNGTRVRPGQGCSDAPLLTHSFVTSVTEPPHTTSTLWTMFKVFFIFFVALPAVVIILYIVRNDIVTLFHTCLSAASKPVFSNIHFNNPAYNLNTSHLETVYHHSRLNPGEHQYENPVAFDNLSVDTQSTITNDINEPTKKPKVIEFNVHDFADDDSTSLEYSEALGESHKAPLIR